MAQHFLLEPVAAAGARQFRAKQQSQELRYELRSSRLVLAGIIGVIIMTVIFVWGTLNAIHGIDAKSIESERDRAVIAVGLLQQSGVGMDSVMARKIGRDFVLADGRVACDAHEAGIRCLGPSEGHGRRSGRNGARPLRSRHNHRVRRVVQDPTPDPAMGPRQSTGRSE